MIYLCTSEKSSLGLAKEDLDEIVAPGPKKAALKFARQLVSEGAEPKRMFVRRPEDEYWSVFRVSRPIVVSNTNSIGIGKPVRND